MFNVSISFKLSAAIVSIMAGALLIISYLNYCNFDKDLQAFVTSRFEVLSKDVRGTIEYGLNLGLGLGELKTIQQILEEKTSAQEDIQSLLVANNQGKVLFHSDPDKLQEDMSSYWYQLFKNNNIIDMKSAITVEDQGNFIQITPLINNFNVKVGSLVLSYPKTIIKKRQEDMIYFLLYRFAIVSAGFAIVIFLITRTFFNHFFKNILSTLEDSLQTLLDDPSKKADQDMEVTADLKHPFLLFHQKAGKLLALLKAEAEKITPRSNENG